MLEFTGTRCGDLLLNTSREFAVQVCANMLGTQTDEVESDGDISDAFGETVNMIAGSFKNLWVGDDNEMNLRIPEVVFGGRSKLGGGKNAVDGINAVLEFEGGHMMEVHLGLEN